MATALLCLGHWLCSVFTSLTSGHLLSGVHEYMPGSFACRRCSVSSYYYYYYYYYYSPKTPVTGPMRINTAFLCNRSMSENPAIYIYFTITFCAIFINLPHPKMWSLHLCSTMKPFRLCRKRSFTLGLTWST